MADTTYTSIADLPPVMDNVYHIFHAGLCKRFTSAYQRIEQSLRDEARCSNNMDVKENCVFAIEDAKDHQEEIAKTFAEALIRSFSDFQKQIEMPEAAPKPVAPSKLDLSHLSLVDDDALQEKIDTQSMVASAMKSCEYLLIPITSGIVQAYSSARVKQLVHPLAPTRVGECLEQALTLGKFKGTARSIVFHLFREELFDNLAPLYKEVIDIFQTFSIELAMQQAQTRSLNITTLEVMPVDIGFGGSTAKPATKKRAQAVSDAQLQARTQRDSANPLQIDAERITQEQPGNTGSETGQQRNNPNGHPTNKNDSASPPYISAKETFIDIETWLRQNPVPDTLTFDAGFTSRLNYDGLSEHTEEDRTIISVSTKQLDKILANIQLEVLRDDSDWVMKLRAYLESRCNDLEVCVISPYQEGCIKLVNHALNYIEKEFHPGIARYLNSLRIAFVRLALTDKAFLKESMHPGKSLFDGLTYLSYGLNPGDKRIIKQLFRVVRAYSDNRSDDIGTEAEAHTQADRQAEHFAQIQHTLLNFIVSERSRIQEQEKKTLLELAAQKQRYLAFKTADAFIKTRLKSVSHRLAFHELLHTALRQVLAESYLSGGADGEQWRVTSQLFTALLWTSQANADEHDKHKLLRALPQLLIKLNTFFKKHNIALDIQSLIVKQITEIQKLITGGVDGRTLTDEDLSHSQTIMYLLQKIKNETQEAYREKSLIGADHTDAAPFPPSVSPDTLQPGQWLAYWVDNNMQMCKYMFHFSPLDKYIFFNWEGEKQFERSTQHVQADLEQGYAKLLDTPIPLESAFRYVMKLSMAQMPTP